MQSTCCIATQPAYYYCLASASGHKVFNHVTSVVMVPRGPVPLLAQPNISCLVCIILISSYAYCHALPWFLLQAHPRLQIPPTNSGTSPPVVHLVLLLPMAVLHCLRCSPLLLIPHLLQTLLLLLEGRNPRSSQVLQQLVLPRCRVMLQRMQVMPPALLSQLSLACPLQLQQQ